MRRFSIAFGLMTLLFTSTTLSAQQENWQQLLKQKLEYPSKLKIEKPLKNLVSKTTPTELPKTTVTDSLESNLPRIPVDSKMRVEGPSKELVASATTATNSKVENQLNSNRVDIKPKFDGSKRIVELPAELILSGSKASNNDEQDLGRTSKPQERNVGRDTTKRIIEMPAKAMIDQPNAESRLMRAAATTESESDEANPTVKPGLVDWHQDFESACEASKESGKPVLLFQLLGQLDQRFT